MLSRYKTSFTPLLDALSFPFRRVNPHYITLLSLEFALLFFLALSLHYFVLSLVLYAGQILDGLDGHVARRAGKESLFGGFLDSTVDRVSDFLIISAFGFAGLISWPIVVMVLMTSFLVSYIRGRAELATKGTKVFNQGIFERPERLIFIFLSLFLFLLIPSFNLFSMDILSLTFILLGILNTINSFQRIVVPYI